MTNKTPPELEAALSHAKTALMLAATDVSRMAPDSNRARQLRLVATLLVGQPDELRISAVEICPDLEFAIPIPDTDLNEDELLKISGLTALDISTIDEAIVLNTTSSWQGVAKVIGYTIVDLKGQTPNLPLGFYATRVKFLNSAGLLQSTGDLDFIRLCKIRLPSISQNAA